MSPMKLLRSKSGDAIGVDLNAVSFRSLLRALHTLPGLKIGKSSQNPMNDEAFTEFIFKKK